jgi:DNA adenine methylase
MILEFDEPDLVINFKSPLKWTGAKTKLINFIFEKRVTCSRFIEPFMGGGTVFLNSQCNNVIANDIMKEPIVVMNSIKNDSLNLIKYLKELSDEFYEYGDEKYYELRKFYNSSKNNIPESQRAAIFLALNHHSFNGVIRFNPKKDYSWNVPFGKRGFKQYGQSKIINEDFISNIKLLSRHFNSVGSNFTFLNDSFDKILEEVCPNDLIYCDPPYLITGSHYGDNWNNETELQLANLLKRADKIGAKFMLSNVIQYGDIKNEPLLELYQQFNTREIEHNYILGFSAKTRKKITEIIIQNF